MKFDRAKPTPATVIQIDLDLTMRIHAALYWSAKPIPATVIQNDLDLAMRILIASLNCDLPEPMPATVIQYDLRLVGESFSM